MTTRELIERLRELDPDGRREVVGTMHSDYHKLDVNDVGMLEAVDRPGADYIMSVHSTMSGYDKASVRLFVCVN